MRCNEIWGDRFLEMHKYTGYSGIQLLIIVTTYMLLSVFQLHFIRYLNELQNNMVKHYHLLLVTSNTNLKPLCCKRN